MSKRKKNGQFPKGPMSQKRRRAISDGQKRRYRRLKEQGLVVGAGNDLAVKKCTKCGEVKSVKRDFVARTRKLASGEVKQYPAGECKECAAERTALWRESVLLEEGAEALARRQREWNRVSRGVRGAGGGVSRPVEKVGSSGG